MAQAVAAEVNILDPDALVIGGGVMNMEGFPKDLLKERIEARLRKPYPAESLEILFAEDEPTFIGLHIEYGYALRFRCVCL